MAPKDAPPPDRSETDQAAGGRPFGVRAVSFAEVAERLLDNGYDPLPIVPGGKAPIPKQWSTLPVDLAQVEVWARAHPHAGVGLRTGHLVGIDIDIDDPDLANQAALLVEARLGVALFRVGRWPRRLYLARTERPFAKIARCSVEILALGQQFVAFGIHEAQAGLMTGRSASRRSTLHTRTCRSSTRRPVATSSTQSPGCIRVRSRRRGADAPREASPKHRGRPGILPAASSTAATASSPRSPSAPCTTRWKPEGRSMRRESRRSSGGSSRRRRTSRDRGRTDRLPTDLPTPRARSRTSSAC